MEIDELKNIWKESGAKDIRFKPGEYDDLISKLRRSERKVIIRYIFMTFFMSYAFYVFIGKLFGLKRYDDLTYIGIYLLLIAMVSVGLMVWSTVIILNKNNIINPSVEFLKNINRKFRRRKLIRKVIIPVYMATITVGITLIYIEVLSSVELYLRILIHILVVVVILGISKIATLREDRRYERTVKPIENKINELLSEYEK